jgi:hypothetical protein
MLIVVSVYVLITIVKKRHVLPATLYEILQILSLALFEKTPVNWLFNGGPRQKIPDADTNQLILFT